MGAYPAALIKVLAESADRATYRDVADQLRDLSLQQGNDQVPQVEGSLDRILVSERIERTPPGSIPVETTADGKLQLQAGSLHGLTTGSQFDFYAAGTKDKDVKNTTPVAKAEIASLDSTTAELTLLPDYAKKTKSLQLTGARAVETVHQYGDNGLRIGFQQIE